MTDVAIIGIGLAPFGRQAPVSGLMLGVDAARAAMADAGVRWEQIDIAFGGSYAAGNADAMVPKLGLTGLPFVNVFNGCATGASSLAQAAASIRAGDADLALAVGFDDHPRGSFDPDPTDWGLPKWYGDVGFMTAPQYFGLRINRYMHEFGISDEALAAVAARAFSNGSRNPNAWRRTPLSAKEIAASPMVCHPLTQRMFCSPSAGGAAVVLCRADLADRYTGDAVQLRSVAVRTRRYGSFAGWTPSVPLEVRESPSADAARAALERAGIGAGDIDVAQIQDTDSGSEIIHMAECGLCEDGEQETLVLSGATATDGALPINTDGGCLASGEPVGASALRQIYESVLQLRGQAGERQVAGEPAVAFTHVIGAPGISACCVLARSR